MKKNFRERTRDFFIKLGQKNSVLRVFAMIGLAVSMLIFRFAEYCRTGGKRFACALFILCCFFYREQLCLSGILYGQGIYFRRRAASS